MYYGSCTNVELTNQDFQTASTHPIKKAMTLEPSMSGKRHKKKRRAHASLVVY